MNLLRQRRARKPPAVCSDGVEAAQAGRAACCSGSVEQPGPGPASGPRGPADVSFDALSALSLALLAGAVQVRP